jgi:hypothetical protein
MLTGVMAPFRRSWGRVAALAPLALAAASVATPAGAAAPTGFLSWGSTPVRTWQLAKCYASALDTLTKDGFTAVEQRPSEVVGTYQGTYATVTCIGTMPKVTAVVMVIGLNQGKTADVRDMLVGQLSGTTSTPSR